MEDNCSTISTSKFELCDIFMRLIYLYVYMYVYKYIYIFFFISCHRVESIATLPQNYRVASIRLRFFIARNHLPLQRSFAIIENFEFDRRVD